MRLVVGRIGRAQGVRGELTVEVRTDSPEERFSSGAVLFTEERPGVPPTVTVESHRWQSGRLVIRLGGVADRTAAEAMRGVVLLADVDVLDNDDDEFHDQALIGLAVRDLDGNALGQVSSVLHLPGQDLLSVLTGSGSELLVPFVSEIVPEVDLEGGFLVVDLPSGLAELGEG